MQVTYARAHAMLAKAEREAEETLETARATGRGIVADAEREAATLREEARALLVDAKRLKSRARGDLPVARGAAVTRPDADPMDLNAAGVEDLRVIGLSLTQARRVIARRERDGGFTSLEQLAELPGMPARLLDQIRPKLRV